MSTVAEDPSSKALLHDSTKSMTTLAAGVLALTVSLVTGLDGAGDRLGLFAIGWLLLVVTIGLCVYASARVISSLSEAADEARAVLFLNLAFFTFVVGALVLSVGAYRAVDDDDDPTLAEVHTEAVDAVVALDPQATGLAITAIGVGDTEIEVDLVDGDGVRYHVVLDALDHEVDSVTTVP